MKTALVVGGARSGKYIALLLNDHDYKVTITDINDIPYKDELVSQGIKVVDNGHPDFLLETVYDLVVKNPGIKYTADFIVKLLALNYKIYNEIEVSLSFRKEIKPLAITGTNGKTTTVSLLHEMMQKQYDHAFLAGNIGIPVSEIIYNEPVINSLVVEVSSFQLDGMFDFHPHIANITNLKPDHLDYYNSIEDYYKVKQKLYANQNANDFLLVNVDDEIVLDYLNHPKAKIVRYGIDKPSDINIVDHKVYYDETLLFDISKMALVGKHNTYNAIVAALMAYLSDVKPEIIQEVAQSFKGVEHRIEYVESINDVKYYNDSKATNIESVIVALEAFERPVLLIAGGYDKNISFDALKAYDSKVSHAILFGETKHKLAEVFTHHTLVETLEDAVKIAHDLAIPEDIVLFSPACASFDQFKDYEERGKLFKQYVHQNHK